MIFKFIFAETLKGKMQIPKALKNRINKRKEEGTLRHLVDLDHLIDFYSNDYLGVSKIPFESTLSQGSTGSRLISGNSKYIEEVEQELASFFGFESGLFYTSGLDANIGIFSCIPERGDTVIMDSLCHASIRDGIRLSFARGYAFRHNDLDHLKERLNNAIGNIYVVVESVYSMDGDVAPLEEIVEICKQYNACLIVDEAHAGGIIGKGGRGLVSSLGLDDDVFIKLITFGKAYGSSGSIVLCSKEMREYFINFSRPFIYTTAISPHAVGRIEQIVKLVETMDKERSLLEENVLYLREISKQKNLNLICSSTPIQAIIIPEIAVLVNKTQELIDSGFAVRAISEPTVPAGTERIRICIHSYNTKEEIKALLDHFDR